MGASPTQYDSLSGFDFSALTSINNSQLIQAINQLKPRSNIGGVIVMSSGNGAAGDTGAPVTDWPGVANNPRFVDYLWIDTYSSPPVLRTHKDAGNRTTPTDNGERWPIANVADASITVAKLASDAVTLAKIQHNEGSARDILRVNAAGTAVEWIAPYSLFTTDEINIISLDDSAAANESYLRRGAGGVMEFQTKANLATSIQALIANLSLNQLDLTGIANGDILQIAAGVPGWSALTPTLLQAGGASADQELAFNGANWVPRASPLKAYAEITPGAPNNLVVATTPFPQNAGHGLGIKPRIVVPYGVCLSAEFGWAIGDEMPLWSFAYNDETFHTNNWPLTWDATNITFGVPVGWNNLVTFNKATGALVSITETSWAFKFRCFA